MTTYLIVLQARSLNRCHEIEILVKEYDVAEAKAQASIIAQEMYPDELFQEPLIRGLIYDDEMQSVVIDASRSM